MFVSVLLCFMMYFCVMRIGVGGIVVVDGVVGGFELVGFFVSVLFGGMDCGFV